jgi:transposase-like protein
LVRLQARGQAASETWKRRRVDDLEVVDVWAEGLYVKAGLEETQAALLGVSGALTDGRHVVLAVESGPRASTAAGGAVRRDLRGRGLKPWRGPSAAGPLGLGAARAAQQPTAAEPRCWTQRLTNGLEAIATQPPAQARTRFCALPDAESQAACAERRAQWVQRHRALAPQAVARLTDDGARRVTFDQLPRDHWRHLRTTTVVESPFAAVRRRTTAATRCKTVDTATAMSWQVLQVAETTCRRLKAPALLPAVSAGVPSRKGVKQLTTATSQEAAA